MGAAIKPSTAHANAKRRAHIKQLLLMPGSSNASNSQTRQQRSGAAANTGALLQQHHVAGKISSKRSEQRRDTFDGPMSMSLRIGAGRSNDAISKGQRQNMTNDTLMAQQSGVNMAFIIGKDKR